MCICLHMFIYRFIYACILYIYTYVCVADMIMAELSYVHRAGELMTSNDLVDFMNYAVANHD